MSELSAHDFEFSREFAAFANYIGGDELHRSVRKVAQKLGQLDPAVRNLFGTRYFFQEGVDQLSFGATPFRLNTSDLLSVRTANFIAGANRARANMSDLAAVRFRRMILDNLKPDRDFRQIEHELRCYIHFRQKSADVKFADLEGLGNFDLIYLKQSETVEVECKTISQDTGNPIKNETIASLVQSFLRLIRNPSRLVEPGIFSIKFKTEPKASNSISGGLEAAVGVSMPCFVELTDATIEFASRPSWRNPDQPPTDKDPDIVGRPNCITRIRNGYVALVLQTDRSGSLSERVIRVLKDAADQLSKQRPSIVWLHFVGLAEQELREIAQFSMDGKGNGLNALVARVVGGTGKDRSHVNQVRFSSEPGGIARRPTLDSQLLLTRTASLDGITYEVPNPFGRYASAKFDL